MKEREYFQKDGFEIAFVSSMEGVVLIAAADLWDLTKRVRGGETE